MIDLLQPLNEAMVQVRAAINEYEQKLAKNEMQT